MKDIRTCANCASQLLRSQSERVCKVVENWENWSGTEYSEHEKDELCRAERKGGLIALALIADKTMWTGWSS